jgi:hypothetical protein
MIYKDTNIYTNEKNNQEKLIAVYSGLFLTIKDSNKLLKKISKYFNIKDWNVKAAHITTEYNPGNNEMFLKKNLGKKYKLKIKNIIYTSQIVIGEIDKNSISSDINISDNNPLTHITLLVKEGTGAVFSNFVLFRKLGLERIKKHLKKILNEENITPKEKKNKIKNFIVNLLKVNKSEIKHIKYCGEEIPVTKGVYYTNEENISNFGKSIL